LLHRKKNKKINRKIIGIGAVVLIIVGNSAIASGIFGNQPLKILKDKIFDTTKNDDKRFILYVGPVGERDLDKLTKYKNLDYNEANEFSEVFSKNTDRSSLDVFNILTKHEIFPKGEKTNDIINYLKYSIGDSGFTKDYPTDISSGAHANFGPHLYVYASFAHGLFNYNIQPVEFFNKTLVIRKILNVTEDDEFLYYVFHRLTENMSLNEYCFFMGATIFIGGSLGRYWSYGLVNSAFGDMTFKIIGPFVGMYAINLMIGFMIYEDPKDGVDPERLWFEFDIGTSLFSMQLETIINWNPTPD